MPKSNPKPAPPFTPVIDPPETMADPVNRRVLQMFDALRRRQVGPDKAAFVVSQVFAKSGADGAHPSPTLSQH